MIKNYSLSNFRVFDKEGATLQLAPLTVLTGCNSSGKSSITKSLMLMNPLMRQIKEEIRSGLFSNQDDASFLAHDLDFTRGHHKLGSFERVVNWSADEKSFAVSYRVYSWAMGDDVDVQFVFVPKDSSDEQHMRAAIREVKMYCREQLFFHYFCEKYSENPKPNYAFREGYSYADLGTFKDELINGLHTLELGDIFDRILKDEQAEDAGFGYLTKFHYGDYESVKGFFSEDVINYLLTKYYSLKDCSPHYTEVLSKRFKCSNIRRDGESGSRGKIDWEASEHEFEFPHQHFYAMTNLMNKLDAQPKDAILEYAEHEFVKSDKIKQQWFVENPVYCRRIKEIFSDFAQSGFEKFSDYYRYYENEALKMKAIGFGARGLGGFNGEFPVGAMGTACWDVEPMCKPFQPDKEWTDMTDAKKFDVIFDCLQGFGGYEDLSMMSGPSPEIPELDIIKDYARLICSEVLAGCDLLTETDFIEIDRSNSQRIYTYAAQGTTFNEALDDYYNLPPVIFSKEWNDKRSYTKGEFVNRWLRELVGVDGFRLAQAPEGVGYFVFVTKHSDDGHAHEVSLADLGFGTTPLLAMLLRMEIYICRYFQRIEVPTLCIEEPESNLHPAVQTRLADALADLVSNYHVNLLVETHSEYFIRGLQLNVAQGKIAPEKISLNYLFSPNKNQRRPEEKNEPQLKHIAIESDGRLADSFGSGFIDEASNSYLKLMSSNASDN